MSRSTQAKRLDVLKFILQRHAEPTVTSLMKLAYLADLLALRESIQLTDYNYIRYYYGPFDRHIYDDVESLISSGYINSEARWPGKGDGDEYYVLKPTDKLNVENDTSLTEDEQRILEDLLNDVRGYGAKTLTEAAYKTRPMTKLGATLGGSEHLMEQLDLRA